MVDLERYRATSGEKNFIERFKILIFMDAVLAPIQFRREGQPHHLKRWFFLKNRPTHFHINRTIVIRPVKWNQLSFPSIKINKPLLTPVHGVSILKELESLQSFLYHHFKNAPFYKQMLPSSHQPARFFASAKIWQLKWYQCDQSITATNYWSNRDMLLQNRKSHIKIFKTVDKEWICY